ncbi:choice-of-anchor I family protein [Tenggerimyces flavus]|uniref:Choice-of-anchor I family protein n=1 Tax=Tenggerimyces flavus TaxID=1708749 RepID=A0ABV7YI23_9ACTN|nr:choice-of-anchor I family protein [Tenggerimyces flavus]MBM7785969.1 DNA-binding beta-propeller fold protein YncE [Tenggerimyces flavus]
MKLRIAACLGLVAATIALTPTAQASNGKHLTVTQVGTYATGIFDEAAAEIVTYDAKSKRLFVVNAAQAKIEVLDARKPATPTKLFDLQTTGTTAADGSTIPDGSSANSVDVRRDGLVAVAVESATKTDNGWVVFFDGRSSTGKPLGAVRVGAQPDMVAFTPDGDYLLAANEGEPNDDFTVDPEGSVAVIDTPRRGVPRQRDVELADFHRFERKVPHGVRIFGPKVNTQFPVSANLEPEYITVDKRSRTAYVTLQEANAIAEIDIRKARVTELRALGVKDHSRKHNGIDPSDRDDAIAIDRVPVYGMYQPDAVASYTFGGRTFLVTANEGDVREWGDYVEAARVKDLGDDGLAPLCAGAFDPSVTEDAELGRLNVSIASGLKADGSCYERLYAFGARSMSIWTTNGRQVFDSGDEFERVTAEAKPAFFNSNHTEANFDGRSDDKGPEPEGVTIGEVRGRTYAFVSLERVGGVLVYDITNPYRAEFVSYVNNRDFANQTGDLGPEGVTFIPADESPVRGTPMLAVANEVSGSTTLYRLDLRRP